MLREKTWKTIDGVLIQDPVQFVKDMFSDESSRVEVNIGTDSQQAGQRTEFVTVIAVVRERKGARAIYARETTPRIKSLRERLLQETWLSVSLGLEMNALIPETAGLTIHVDANPDVRFRSSDFVKELTAMVVSQGFNTLLKPESWVATHVADYAVKHKVLGM
jgi:predicted RNase H-related nuclease YkuK (DUF458 family)